MSDTNVLEKFLKGAAEEIDRKRRAKPQQLNGQYRNRAWYLHLFPNLDADEAFNVVANNIKRKSFSHEPEIAIAAYEEFYNRKFQSKEAREIEAQLSEVERLRAEIAELKAAKAGIGSVADKSADNEQADVSGFEPPVGLTKDEFKPIFYEWFEKSQGRKPNGGQFTAAWGTYCKKNEVQGLQ